MQYISQGLRVKVVYEGHLVKVKVTAAKKLEISYFRNVKLPSATTPVISNTEPHCLHAAWGFQVWRIEWRTRHLCHVTRNEYA